MFVSLYDISVCFTPDRTKKYGFVQASIVCMYTYMYTYRYMNVTLYIHANNEPDFLAEANKSGLINELLAKHYGLSREGVVHTPSAPVFVPKAPDPITGYPCCQLKKPCKHWAWDGNMGVWQNDLTGEIKEG